MVAGQPRHPAAKNLPARQARRFWAFFLSTDLTTTNAAANGFRPRSSIGEVRKSYFGQALAAPDIISRKTALRAGSAWKRLWGN